MVEYRLNLKNALYHLGNGIKNVINIHAVIYNISNKYKLIEANTELTLAVKKISNMVL